MTDDTDRGRSAERASELIDRVGGQSASRRAFLGNTAKVGGGALALSAIGAGSAAAKSGMDGESGDDDGGMDEDMNGDGEVTDLDVLNYALTLEHLEAAYYNEFLSEYSEGEVESSSVAKVLTGGGNDRYTIYQKIEQVRDHEEAHVDALTKTINDLGGEPVEPLEYAFPYETIEDFAALSATIEAVGVSAYAGAGPLIESEAVVKAALSIHSVEARHTAYFNVLNTTNPFPDAFDEPRTMEEVLAIATDFIVS
jgi:hypothetical protein